VLHQPHFSHSALPNLTGTEWLYGHHNLVITSLGFGVLHSTTHDILSAIERDLRILDRKFGIPDIISFDVAQVTHMPDFISWKAVHFSVEGVEMCLCGVTVLCEISIFAERVQS